MIHRADAATLCQSIVSSLFAWPPLEAALQSGGLEQKASGVIEKPIVALAKGRARIVVREYRHADYCLVLPSKVGSARLRVDTVIEVKFSYAKQISEITARMPKAVVQANAYRGRFSANAAYVLYFIAAPSIAEIPPPPRDSGWPYWNHPLPPAIRTLNAVSRATGARRIASYTAAEHHAFHCALFKCP